MTTERLDGWERRQWGSSRGRNFAAEAKAADDLDLALMINRLEDAEAGTDKPTPVLIAQLNAMRVERARRHLARNGGR